MKTLSQRRAASFVGGVLISAVLGLLSFCSDAKAAPGDWFSWTNEAGDNDPHNLLNWRWARSVSMPGGVGPYGNPTSLAQLQGTRQMVSGAGSGLSTLGNVYNYMDVGTGKSLVSGGGGQAIDGGITIDVHGTGFVNIATTLAAIGQGINVTRDMSVGLGGDGWGTTNLYYRPPLAAGSWNNPANYTSPSAVAPGFGGFNVFANSVDTTFNVFNGGSLTLGSLAAGAWGNPANSQPGSHGHLGFILDSTQALGITATFGVVTMPGSNNGGGVNADGAGGGFLDLRGYNAATVITMTGLNIDPAQVGIDILKPAVNGAGQLGSTQNIGNGGLFGVSTGANNDAAGAGFADGNGIWNNIPGGAQGGAFPAYLFSPGSGTGHYLANLFPGNPDTRLTYDSEAPELSVTLTAQNAGGLFNTVMVAGNLRMLAPGDAGASANWTSNHLGGTFSWPLFDLNLSGYTPIAGDIFQIVDAVTFDATGNGRFAVADWDTDFLLGGATWQLHKAGLQGPGIYLEVIEAAAAANPSPEPGTIGLAMFGFASLCLGGRRRKRA